ncbi:hypothetical protein ACVW0Y_003723 [Pseudomonas sp. TE3786]
MSTDLPSPVSGFVDQYVVVTGTFSGYTRPQLEDLISQQGGTIQKSVNGKTTLLVSGSKPGTDKTSKAAALGVQVMQEAEALARLAGGEAVADAPVAVDAAAAPDADSEVAKTNRAMLKRAAALAEQYQLPIDAQWLAAPDLEQTAPHHVHQLFGPRSCNHNMEQGSSPSWYYPQLLQEYAAASGGELEISDVESDSDDGWDSALLLFKLGGKKQRIRVKGVEDSDWFSPEFVKALNRAAKRWELPGRWVDFYDRDDGCTSVYVPAEAEAAFIKLRKAWSAHSGAEEEKKMSAAEEKAYMAPHLAEIQKMDRIPPLPTYGQTAAGLAARKASWPSRLQRIQYMGFYTKREMKAFEQYYLSAKEPRWDNDQLDDPIPLVLRLWLHPDNSDENWCAITEHLLSYPGRNVPMYSLSDSSKLMYHAERSTFTYFSNDAAIDAFDGDEKRLYQFLTGQTECSRRFRFDGKPLYSASGSHNGYMYNELTKWLDHEPQINPHSVLYYALDAWAVYLDAPKRERTFAEMDPEDSQRLRKYLRKVAHYPAPVAGGSDLERQEYCQQVREILDSRELVPRLAEWWVQAKRGDGVLED